MGRKLMAAAVAMAVCAMSAQALWVPSGHDDQDDLMGYSEAPGNSHPFDETQEPTYIWVEIPSFNMSVVPAASEPSSGVTAVSAPSAVVDEFTFEAESAEPEFMPGDSPSDQVEEVPAAPQRVGKATADIEYEHYTWNVKKLNFPGVSGKWHANGLLVNGRYEQVIGDIQAWGVRFSSYNSKGWVYDTTNFLGNTASFTVAGSYRRFLLDWLQVGGFLNLAFTGGSGPSGLQMGPTIFGMATPHIGPVRIWSGLTVGYAFNTFTNYVGRAHHDFPWSAIVGVGVPIGRIIAVNVEVQGNERFLDLGINGAIRVADKFDIVPGFKKTWLFGWDAFQNWRITLGASRPF